MSPPHLLFIPDRDHRRCCRTVRGSGCSTASRGSLDNHHITFANGPAIWCPTAGSMAVPQRAASAGENRPARRSWPSKRIPLRWLAPSGATTRQRKVVEVDQRRHQRIPGGQNDWNETRRAFLHPTTVKRPTSGGGGGKRIPPGAHFVVRTPSSTNNRAPYRADRSARRPDWHFDNTRERAGQKIPRWRRHRTIGGGHAHIGMKIYQGDNWPVEYRGPASSRSIFTGRRAKSGNP
jgi:hypothetical protein